MPRTVLVVGASGVLAPLVTTLEGRGDTVIGISRHRPDGSDIVDARDAAALATALDGQAWDDAVAYGPAVTEESLDWLRASTPGRCIIVRTTDSADPARSEPTPSANTLQLGWAADTSPRWHTADEISRAALEVLDSGASSTLGAVRPWSDRP